MKMKCAMLFVVSVRHQNAQVCRVFGEIPILVLLTTSNHCAYGVADSRINPNSTQK